MPLEVAGLLSDSGGRTRDRTLDLSRVKAIFRQFGCV